MEDALPPRGTRLAVAAFSIVLSLLVLSPAWRDPPADSFPLSDYPMFSHGRPDPGLTLTHALGVRSDSTSVPLAPPISAGNAEVLQSMVTIHRSVFGGRGPVLCEEIAERVLSDPSLDAIQTIELVTSEFDCVRYFDETPEPISRNVHVRCPVRRGPR